MTFAARITAALVGAVLTASVAGCSGKGQQVDSGPGWLNQTIYAATNDIKVGSGVVAATVLRQDRKLHTVVLDLTDGQELWDQPTTMVGRLTGLGVQPPAIVQGDDGGLVVALEPLEKKQSGNAKTNAMLVARDARTGTKEWTRPVHSTFGPTACGSYVCLSEDTSQNNPHFVVLDPRTGKAIWKIPGIAEVQYADKDSIVVMSIDGTPTLESRELRTGRMQWKVQLSQAVGGKVNLAGGWYFARIGTKMIGYVGPYQTSAQEPIPGYGFFAVDLRNGRLVWKHQQMVRLYPNPDPTSLLLTRQGAPQDWRDFVRLDPKTGRPTARIPLKQVPQFQYWLGYSADLKTLGFLPKDTPRAGAAFDLTSGQPVKVDGRTVWSYCTRNPRPLPIAGHEGFYMPLAMCEYNLADGKRLNNDEAPPTWVTGVTDGWRVWRDASGAVHGIKDSKGTSPGMYG